MLKISVITCTFNAEQVLAKTLESVAQQSYPEVEHIIIDGCSTDKTLAMVRSYQAQQQVINSPHHISMVSEPDKGLYDAMNKGIEKATGHYLVFMNAGDTFHAFNTLETVMKTAASESLLPGVLYGETHIVNNEGTFLYERRLKTPSSLSWKSFRKGMVVCHQSFYTLTSIAKETPYDLSFRLSADVDWCIRVMKKTSDEGRSLVNTRTVLCNYLEEGLSTKHHKASLKERFMVMCRHYGLASTLFMHFFFIFRLIFLRRQ